MTTQDPATLPAAERALLLAKAFEGLRVACTVLVSVHTKVNRARKAMGVPPKTLAKVAEEIAANHAHCTVCQGRTWTPTPSDVGALLRVVGNRFPKVELGKACGGWYAILGRGGRGVVCGSATATDTYDALSVAVLRALAAEREGR